MSNTSPPSPSPAILLTNDDGLDPSHALVLPLGKRLAALGHSVVVVAPGRDSSACGQRITLGKPLTLRRHAALERAFGGVGGSLEVFSLDDGSPADCVIAAVEPSGGLLARLGRRPVVCVSGVNLGQNLGNDVLYSGTFAAARQAAMYGVPGIAVSVDLFRAEAGCAEDARTCARAVEAGVAVARAALAGLRGEQDVGRVRPRPGDFERGGGLHAAFAAGDVVLNVNVPRAWDGGFETTTLDCVLYRGAVDVAGVPGDGEEVQVVIASAGAEYMRAPGSDVAAVLGRRRASVTPVSTWPAPHAMAVPVEVLAKAVGEGLPDWLGAPVGVERAEKG